MWCLLFGALCPVDLGLNSILDSESIVLDVGCGAGHWYYTVLVVAQYIHVSPRSLDFAREYPEVQVIGFDLAISANIVYVK